jgi:hypothetical protein
MLHVYLYQHLSFSFITLITGTMIYFILFYFILFSIIVVAFTKVLTVYQLYYI